MRYLSLLILPLLLAQAGCDTSYPNEEMDIAGSAKTRPFAIVCDPPEAEPGDLVSVTLHYYEPDPEHHDVSWRVAVDYDLGLYETDEVERDIVALDSVEPPSWDAHGFCIQSFAYRVPEDALQRASSLPETITDELILAYARPLLDKGEDEPVAKREIIALLDALAGADDWWSGQDPAMVEAVRRLGDLFASRIRFRATVDGTARVDVTKTLTVRYTDSLFPPLGSVSVNHNPVMTSPAILIIPAPDVAFEDHDSYADELMHYELTPAGAGGEPSQIPLREDWTYYLVTNITFEYYESPYEPVGRSEKCSARWYHFGLSGAPRRALFVQDDGDEAEMGDLDGSVRMMPPPEGYERSFRIVLVVRDERLEWRNYAFSPGVAVSIDELEFVDP